MHATLPDGTYPIRLAFEKEATTPDEARVELVRMVKKARKMLSSQGRENAED